MPHENRAIVKRRELVLERLLPCRVARIILVRHPWISDLEIRSKLAPQALDKLAVPVVMRSGTCTLDEEQLTSHGAPPCASRSRRRLKSEEGLVKTRRRRRTMAYNTRLNRPTATSSKGQRLCEVASRVTPTAMNTAQAASGRTGNQTKSFHSSREDIDSRMDQTAATT